jgi:uncharacterized protein YfaS (alpha-2-macroglobulin family)
MEKIVVGSFYPGSKFRIVATYKDKDDIVIDPATPYVKVKDATGATVQEGAPTREGTGVYYFDIEIPYGAVAGWWYAEFSGGVGELKAVERAYFVVKS